MDKSVVNTTFRAVNGASLPYLAAKMATVSPATKYVVPTDHITMRIGIKKIEV